MSSNLITSEEQRPNEMIARVVDVTPVGSSPSNPVLTVWKIDTRRGVSEDVTAVVATGDCSVTDNLITTARVGNLTDGALYHKVLRFLLGGNTLEYYWEIRCTDRRP
ncbi:MAG: hypothetical protein KJ063_02185 [Anaerolineae bacterium]|nr:hypothetical protein [Anaerolineae bacterium]